MRWLLKALAYIHANSGLGALAGILAGLSTMSNLTKQLKQTISNSQFEIGTIG